jgi:hypothetical protein
MKKFRIERLEERIAPGKLQCACSCGGTSHKKHGSHKGGSHKGGSHKGGSSKVRCAPPPPRCG